MVFKARFFKERKEGGDRVNKIKCNAPVPRRGARGRSLGQ